MTLAQHDDHRCQLRVLSLRPGRPLPIARSNAPPDPSIALFDPSFASPTDTTARWLSRGSIPDACSRRYSQTACVAMRLELFAA